MLFFRAIAFQFLKGDNWKAALFFYRQRGNRGQRAGMLYNIKENPLRLVPFLVYTKIEVTDLMINQKC
jgi:hypothetical protein